ncbi:hypothetical protein LOC68_05685 [Blastopirellula sp. JC732]|uniref:Uncharacterized protein n=1 Tax=Blastopirellula sediminis TaxID=2894196 RepID=A0A9X1MIQ3_9BACT|nr:hypothetical protein [Blastopirellula sediminis]MCC9609345.1 hypothetical protein [Blastopirellula sediminis]MCC9627878.1 hypothetical protein [Blastopirellula sediminis]
MRYEFLIEQVERLFELVFDFFMFLVNMIIAASRFCFGRSDSDQSPPNAE